MDRDLNLFNLKVIAYRQIRAYAQINKFLRTTLYHANTKFQDQPQAKISNNMRTTQGIKSKKKNRRKNLLKIKIFFHDPRQIFCCLQVVLRPYQCCCFSEWHYRIKKHQQTSHQAHQESVPHTAGHMKVELLRK